MYSENYNRSDVKIETVIDKYAARPAGRFASVLQSPLVVAIVIAVITLAVFINVLSADFVMWDDDISIYQNPNIRDLSIARLGKIFTDVDSMMRYNPLTLLGWSITYHFFGAKPFWYHLGNWLMHGLNAALIFLVLRKLLLLAFFHLKTANKEPWRITLAAGLAALLWSIHPMRVEPVAWCTDRTYCQALLFLLLSLLFYLQANEPDKSISRHYILLTVSVILYIVSLLSHAIGMTFFLVLIVIDIYPLRKINFGNRWWKTPANRRTLLEKIPFAAAALVIALVTVCIRIASAGVWTKPVSLAQFGINERFWQAIYIWAYYIWRPWYPVNLSPVYTTLVTFKPFSVFIFSAILVIGIIILTMVLRRRWPLGLTLVMCHLFLLIPVLGIFEHPHYPCDRYSLIVSILWSILLAAWLAYPKTKTLPYSISIVLSSIVIVTLGFLTFQQTRIWTNSKTLFTHVIKMLGNDPYRSDTYWRLGTVYMLEDNIDEGIKYCAKAVEIDPNDLMAQNSLGIMLMQKNNAEEAIRHFSVALLINPDDALTHINRAKALLMLSRFDEAIACLNEVIKDKPGSANAAKAHYFLATAYSMDKKYDDAIKAITSTLALVPNYPDARRMMGSLLLTTGKLNEAIPYLNDALQPDANQAEIYANLGLAYHQLGKFKQAIQVWTKVIELKPDNASVLNNLAWLFAVGDTSIQDVNRAVEYAERVCKLTGYKEAAFLDTLAVAYAAAGRFKDAIATAEQAINIAKTQNREILVGEIQGRLDLYRAGKPYREK